MIICLHHAIVSDELALRPCLCQDSKATMNLSLLRLNAVTCHLARMFRFHEITTPLETDFRVATIMQF